MVKIVDFFVFLRKIIPLFILLPEDMIVKIPRKFKFFKTNK